MIEQDRVVYRAGISERIAVPPLAAISAYISYAGAASGYFSLPINYALYAIAAIILSTSLHPFLRKVVVAKDYISYRKLFVERVVPFNGIEAYWMELFNNREPRSLKIRYLKGKSIYTLEIKRSRIFYVGQIFERFKNTLPDKVPDCTEEVFTSMGTWRRIQNEFHFWVVVVAILVASFLASIILPHIITFKPKRTYSSARIELVRIGLMQKEFRRVYGVYASGFQQLGYKPLGENTYTYFFSRKDVIRVNRTGYDKMNYNEINNVVPDVARIIPEHSQPDSYTVVAVGNVDGNDGLDVWTITNDSNVVHLTDGKTGVIK